MSTDEQRGNYDHIKCCVCGHPWATHSPECSRHEWRPGAALAALAQTNGAHPDAARAKPRKSND